MTVLGACGEDDSGEGSSSGTQQKFVAKPLGGVPGGLLPEEIKLWKYNFDTGKYDVVEGEVGEYEPNIRRPKRPLLIAYHDGYGGLPFTVAIKQNLERLAEENGFRITYCDSQFKAEKAISCAEQLAAKKPDFAIESNFVASAAKSVMAVWNKARIPAANIDVAHPNGIFFGANNYESGLLGGRAAGEYAQQEWGCEDVTVLGGGNPAEGEVANQRLTGFADGVQEVCGKLPDDAVDNITLDSGTADQAITKSTDWLTANPQAKHILATSIDDPRATGIAKAIKQSQRDGVAVGPGCDEIGVAEVMKGVETSRYLGCVAYYPERYPDYLVSIGLDVLDGKPVPQEVHIEHKFFDQDTIGGYQP